MSVLLQVLSVEAIHREIIQHAAWHGQIPGLSAEKLLRGKNRPYLYLLRQGEMVEEKGVFNYYVSFILPDYSVRHQPFTITVTDQGWFYENYREGGPFVNETIDDVLYKIMHCEPSDCLPLST